MPNKHMEINHLLSKVTRELNITAVPSCPWSIRLAEVNHLPVLRRLGQPEKQPPDLCQSIQDRGPQLDPKTAEGNALKPPRSSGTNSPMGHVQH